MYRGAAVLFGAEDGADSNTRPFCAEGAEKIFSQEFEKKMATNSLTKIFLKSMHFEHFFGFGQNFRKMAARILPVGLGLPCIGEPPYYLVQRIAARI